MFDVNRNEKEYKEQIKDLRFTIDYYKNKTNRLNNNINELEEYIIENSFTSLIHNTNVIEASKVLDKIKELKGEDKK